MTEQTKFLVDVVKQASLLITDEFEVKAKGNNGDLVTNFDFEIEKFIISKLEERYPDYSIISEEFNKDEKIQKNCFTIDPIDGTINFANGLPLWGIQVACIENYETCSAVIYLPRFNELYCADKTGAYLNGKKLNVKPKESSRCLYVIEGKNRLNGIARMGKVTSHARWIGSTAVDYSWVASGRLGGTIFRNDSAWDYMPGMYLAKQAGAYVIEDSCKHIAACSKEFAEALDSQASFKQSDKDEKFSF